MALTRRDGERMILSIARNEKNMSLFVQYTHGDLENSHDADDHAYLYLEWKKAT